MLKTVLIARNLMLFATIVIVGCSKPNSAISKTAVPPNVPVVESSRDKHPPQPVQNLASAAVVTQPVREAFDPISAAEVVAAAVTNAAPVVTTAAVTPSAVRPFTELPYLPAETVGLIVIHPHQILRSPIGRLLADIKFEQQSTPFLEFFQRSKLGLADLERVTVAVEQPQLNWVAHQAGFQVGPATVETGESIARRLKHKDALRRIGAGFQAYSKEHNRFPRADGDGAGEKTGLSWRVHLLPFIGHVKLYERFHLKEPWDSEHNKALIADMPDLFHSSDVTEAGKTAFHVFTGDKTPFRGDQGLAPSQLKDGTLNIILAVKVAAARAEIWTKPGGLAIDLKNPKSAIGKLQSDYFLAVMFAGNVIQIPRDIDDGVFARLIQPDDGAPVEVPSVRTMQTPEYVSPLMCISLLEDRDTLQIAKQLLTGTSEITVNQQTVFKSTELAAWPIDKRTILLGNLDAVTKAVQTKALEPASTSLSELLGLESDATFAISMNSQAALVKQFSTAAPMMGVLVNVKHVSGRLLLASNGNEPLLKIVGTAKDAKLATGLSSVIGMGLTNGKKAAENSELPPNPSSADQKLNALVKNLIKLSELTSDGDQIVFRIPAVPELQQLPELLGPTVKQLSATTTASP